jgi:hypothetical protein
MSTEHKVESKKFLELYELIRKNGDKTELGHRFEGLEAYTDFDGYSVYVTDGFVTLKIGFHNTHHMDYLTQLQLDDFFTKVNRIYLKYCLN